MIEKLIKLANVIEKYDDSINKKLIFTINKIAGILQDLIGKYPNYEAELQLASRAVKPNFLKWVVLQLDRNEPIDEIINMIKEFEKYINGLTIKDLYKYNSLGELRDAINTLGESSKSKKKKEVSQNLKGQYDVLYEDEKFAVYYPHSKEASCYLGNGTRWCVSATQSRNYFNSYSSDNVFLYFIITKNNYTPIEDDSLDMTKIAYAGTKQNKNIKFQIFDAKDDTIQEEDVQKYLKDKYSSIHTTIENHIQNQENTKFNEMIERTDLETFKAQSSQIKDMDEFRSFREAYIRNPRTNPEILKFIFEDTKDFEIWLDLSRNQNLPKEVVDKLIPISLGQNKDPEQIENYNTYEDIVEEALYDSSLPDLRIRLAKNPNVSVAVLNEFLNLLPAYEPEHYIAEIFKSPNINENIIRQQLANDKIHKFKLIRLLPKNIFEKFPEFIVDIYNRSDSFKESLASNKNLPSEYVELLLHHALSDRNGSTHKNNILESFVLNKVLSTQDLLKVMEYASSISAVGEVYSKRLMETIFESISEEDAETFVFLNKNTKLYFINDVAHSLLGFKNISNILKKLAQDSDPKVQANAKQRLELIARYKIKF